MRDERTISMDDLRRSVKPSEKRRQEPSLDIYLRALFKESKMLSLAANVLEITEEGEAIFLTLSCT